MVAETGNTILRPPRRTGDNAQDLDGIIDWLQDLYSSIVADANVIGTLDDVTQRLAAAEAKLREIGELTALAGPISGTFDPQQLADAFNKINAIIQRAKG